MKQAYDKLDQLMNEYASDKVFPGATYSLCSNNEKYEGVCGYKSLIPKMEENSIDTLYDMASLTKVIVTNTILTRALQANLLSLSDKIGKFLPKYSCLDITVYDIVTHQSGLPADFDLANLHSNDDLQRQLDNIKLEYKTGTNVVYSDQGFILLGKILEQVYGDKLDVIAEKEVFIPLGMYNSTFHPNFDKCAPTELTTERGLVRGRTHDEKAYYSNSIVGHAGLFTDVDDVTKFVQMVLNDGIVDDKIYLQKEYLDMWFSTEVTEANSNRKRSIGWLVGANNVAGFDASDNVISHTGFTGTSIVIDRDRNIGIIVLSNRVHPTRTNRMLVSKRQEITQIVNENIDKVKMI